MSAELNELAEARTPSPDIAAVAGKLTSERCRRLSWLARNALVTPIIPIRIGLFVIYKLGCAAEWIGMRTPGFRSYDNWRGW